MSVYLYKSRAVCPGTSDPTIPIDHNSIFTHDENSEEDDTVTVNISELDIISAEESQRLRNLDVIEIPARHQEYPTFFEMQRMANAKAVLKQINIKKYSSH